MSLFGLNLHQAIRVQQWTGQGRLHMVGSDLAKDTGRMGTVHADLPPAGC